MRKADAVLRAMRGERQALRLFVFEKQSSFLASAIAIKCVDRFGAENGG